MIFFLVFSGAAVLVVIIFISFYNNLVTLRNRFKNAFSQIDVQLKRRYDLIPNLVETVKGYMEHEREALEAVIRARNSAMSASNNAALNPADPSAIHSLAGAEGALSGALSRIFALSESYPELKANQNMLALQEELTSTENRIAFARQAFNDAVTSYNVGREKFPNSIITNLFNFSGAELLESTGTEEERKVPRIAF
ncbi:MAG: LemA family protein [Desulfobacterales bacterium]